MFVPLTPGDCSDSSNGAANRFARRTPRAAPAGDCGSGGRAREHGAAGQQAQLCLCKRRDTRGPAAGYSSSGASVSWRGPRCLLVHRSRAAGYVWELSFSDAGAGRGSAVLGALWWCVALHLSRPWAGPCDLGCGCAERPRAVQHHVFEIHAAGGLCGRGYRPRRPPLRVRARYGQWAPPLKAYLPMVAR